MTPEFANLVNPTFHYVLALVDRLQRGESINLEFERNRIRGELQDSDITVASPDYAVSRDDYNIAKRALVYWVDEVMTVADHRWKDLGLEIEFYGTRDRAWEFYVRAETEARNRHPDVVETFYLALVLGFVGDIRDAFLNQMRGRPLPGNVEDPEKARQLFGKDLSRQIRQAQPGSGPPAPQLMGDVRPLLGGKLFSVAMGSLVLALLLLGLLFALSPADKPDGKKKTRTSEYSHPWALNSDMEAFTSHSSVILPNHDSSNLHAKSTASTGLSPANFRPRDRCPVHLQDESNSHAASIYSGIAAAPTAESALRTARPGLARHAVGSLPGPT